MKRLAPTLLLLATLWPLAQPSLPAKLIFETTSPYHHIRVIEEAGYRTLCFDDTTQTKMSVTDPLKGHFEYTEYFHMPVLWNTNLSSVLIVGLGGGSSQVAFERYYPKMKVETVEIDSSVVHVAEAFFKFKESERQKVHVADGRMFLKRTTSAYDLIILDAYTGGRYGSSIPQHLATKEYFELAKKHLTTNGIVAYNVIGTVSGWRADIVGAIYRTLGAVFPQVYLFPARNSYNVVIVATMSPLKMDIGTLRQRANLAIQGKVTTFPALRQRLESFQATPPANAARSPVLTDDYAPVEGLSGAADR